MENRLLHIFRNNPFGRETLLQSIYFCNKVGAFPVIYIPKTTKFLMYFDNDVVQVDLDKSYLISPETALKRATELLEQGGISARFLDPKHFTASTLPDIHTNFDYMCCPRSVSDMSSKIGLGYIGPRVRRIVRSARFPVLITSPVYKEWKSIAVFFGGSANAIKALRLGFHIARASGIQLDVFTQTEKFSKEDYQQIIKDRNLEEEMELYVKQWHFFENRVFEENLYDVPHDALVILGAFGHGVIRNFVFGSKMEKIQSTISNNLLIAGPNYTTIR
ncbi:MAG: universal stress protein [Desulfobacteraceae bacterium]|nr:universal stress protein [Desulfobacteraceae bacterium]MDH3574030.1 universal stress protein [Desulfobacteraceae bacterium]MDH3721029.1 universal stress protein [Desulfobacteraceae bacterium]MDH3836666.1 universal stress protein [Desulfobacteraceae bacterium]MDH3874215.1 universal stress protein [Desulfobacteraceae bacterium]